MKKALILGGGVGGAVTALELKKKNWDVLIVERAKTLGGGIRTHFVGGHPCTFGPRHFLTHNQKVYQYFSEYVPMRRCQEHVFLSYVESDSQFYNYPIHYDDIPRMPEGEAILEEVNSLDQKFRENEYKLCVGSEVDLGATNYREFWLKSIGPTLYKKFIESYTRKMWQVEDERVIDDFTWSPKGVAIKSGPREGWDSAISAYPIGIKGYDPIFELVEKDFNILFGVKSVVMEPNSLQVNIDGDKHNFDLVVNSASVDEIFSSSGLPKLRYIGRTLQYVVLPVEYALPKNVYFCYYTGKEKFTRVTEYKKFTQFESPHTLISIETPSEQGRYYPMPTAKYKKIYSDYKSLMHNNFHCIGRIGRYNYRYDIDDAVEQALELTASI